MIFLHSISLVILEALMGCGILAKRVLQSLTLRDREHCPTFEALHIAFSASRTSCMCSDNSVNGEVFLGFEMIRYSSDELNIGCGAALKT